MPDTPPTTEVLTALVTRWRNRAAAADEIAATTSSRALSEVNHARAARSRLHANELEAVVTTGRLPEQG